MRILLVSPCGPDDLSQQVIARIPYLLADAFFAPQACVAVAALTPPSHEIVIHDEHLHGPVDGRLASERFDVVGLSLICNQVNRSLAIAERFVALGRPGRLVVGGVGTSHMVPRMAELVDHVFLGEAEQTWPRFLQDLEAGHPARVYRTIVRPDMARVPVPRWDLIAKDLPRYSSASVQTTRGCPFDCSFCDVIYTFGRALRQKPVDQVVHEVEILAALRPKMIYLADDNFAADRTYAKALLRRLAELNHAQPVQLSFMTQVDLTVATDEELLQLMQDANLVEVQIGIESPDEAPLRAMNKLHNARLDPVAAVKAIQAHGIVVLAHLIVGTDADDAGTFERLARFIDEAGIVHHLGHPLMAPPGTRLWYELKAAGRIIDPPDEVRDLMDVTTNIVPARLDRPALMEGLADHWERAVLPERFLERAIAFLRGIRHEPSRPYRNQPGPWRMRRSMARLLRFVLVELPPARRRLFFALFQAARRRSRTLIPRAIFLFTLHVMEAAQARLAAAKARELAARERALPGGLPTLPTTVPVPEALRREGRAVVRAAYQTLRPLAGSRESLYGRVVAALVAFVEQSGGAFETFDETAREALSACCARALAARDEAPLREGEPGDGGSLPSDPPPGFTRDILDALDRELRVRCP